MLKKNKQRKKLADQIKPNIKNIKKSTEVKTENNGKEVKENKKEEILKEKIPKEEKTK